LFGVDEATVGIVEMVLAGRVNKGLVSLIQVCQWGGRGSLLVSRVSLQFKGLDLTATVNSAPQKCTFSPVAIRCCFLLIIAFGADEITMDIVEMVLAGRVNKGLVSLIQSAGGEAVGLCGKDSNLLVARQLVEKDIGYVGEVTRVNKDLLVSLVERNFIPVVSTVAVDIQTGHALNVNADTAAGEIAASLQVWPASACFEEKLPKPFCCHICVSFMAHEQC
jgi:acetylglutamate kinase